MIPPTSFGNVTPTLLWNYHWQPFFWGAFSHFSCLLFWFSLAGVRWQKESAFPSSLTHHRSLSFPTFLLERKVFQAAELVRSALCIYYAFRGKNSAMLFNKIIRYIKTILYFRSLWRMSGLFIIKHLVLSLFPSFLGGASSSFCLIIWMFAGNVQFVLCLLLSPPSPFSCSYKVHFSVHEESRVRFFKTGLRVCGPV